MQTSRCICVPLSSLPRASVERVERAHRPGSRSIVRPRPFTNRAPPPRVRSIPALASAHVHAQYVRSAFARATQLSRRACTRFAHAHTDLPAPERALRNGNDSLFLCDITRARLPRLSERTVCVPDESSARCFVNRLTGPLGPFDTRSRDT